MWGEACFLISVLLGGALLTTITASAYMRRVRMARPPTGVFTQSDVALLLIGLFLVPFLYTRVPELVLICSITCMLFVLLFIGLRPILSRTGTWLSIGALLAGLYGTSVLANLGWEPGEWLHWIVNDLVVVIAVVSAGNLYAQGGMRLRYVVGFLMVFAVYDGWFAWINPITSIFSGEFTGALIQPSLGLVMGSYRANIGQGDLLAFVLFALCAEKGFGKKGKIVALFHITLCGVILPASIFLLLMSFTGRTDILFPVQVIFGPTTFFISTWLFRRQRERNTGEWFRFCGEKEIGQRLSS